jgi:hypothetical protein
MEDIWQQQTEARDDVKELQATHIEEFDGVRSRKQRAAQVEAMQRSYRHTSKNSMEYLRNSGPVYRHRRASMSQRHEVVEVLAPGLWPVYSVC